MKSMVNQNLEKFHEQTSSQPGVSFVRTKQYSILQALSFFFIGLGVYLRFAQFISGRSLWADEAKLALNIIDRSYPELTQVLDYNQVAPIGFLFIEKLSIQLFGVNEFALRLFPFLSGIFSLVLIYIVAKRYLSPVAVPIATALLALLPRHIYYSSELKQYSSDLMIALLLVAVIHPLSNSLSKRQWILFAIIGAIAIWISHPAIFILAGLAVIQTMSQIIEFIKTRKFPFSLPWMWVYGTWCISFLGFYFLSVSTNSSNDTLLLSWASRRAFPASFPDFDWVFFSLKRFFRKPLDFPDPIIHMYALSVFTIGTFALGFKRRKALLIMVMPILMTMAAAHLYRYPFYSRVVIFLIPFFILVMAEGLAILIDAKPQQKWLRFSTAFVGLSLSGFLVYFPASEARAYFTPPVTNEEIKPLLHYVEDNWQENDLIYVFQKSQFQFEFYREQFGIQSDDYVISVDPDEFVEKSFSKVRQLYRKDLRQYCGHNRLWVLASDIHIRLQREYMLSYLDELGQRIDSFAGTTPAASVYLYDLESCNK